MRILHLTIMVFFLVLTVSSLQANPVISFYLNELKVDSIDWIIELHTYFPTSLDGWYLSSLSDTAYLKMGMMVDTSYSLITSDSLVTPLHINPLGDIIMLFDYTDTPVDLIAFGNMTAFTMVSAPILGQTLCLYNNADTDEYFWYIDNSPSLGLVNDSTHARGNVEGVVTDSSGFPLDNVQVVYGYYQDSLGNFLPRITQTNSAGFFQVRDYAKWMTFEFSKQNFQYTIQGIQNWPDSTVTLQVMLEPVVRIADQPLISNLEHFTLLANYPNPFNSLTRISFKLPVSGVLELSVYDLLGRKVKTILKEFRPAGTHYVYWNGRDDKNQDVSSDIYFLQLKTGNLITTRKIMVLR